MEVNGISIVDKAESGTNASAKRISATFDQFLRLLTAQMQNQDPLSPLDGTEFTNQLVQFSNVEQSINQNLNLEELIKMQRSSQASQAVSYIGKTVLANGSEAALEGGKATWQYTLSENSATTTLNILNTDGDIVRTMKGSNDAGIFNLVWDGTDNDGGLAPDGIYSLTVGAKDANDKFIDTTTDFVGLVEGVNSDNGEINLIINGFNIPVESVISIHETPPAPAA